MTIIADKLIKEYKTATALKGIDLQITEPKIYGLLGRNGAGKTTFMQLLAGYDKPSGGELHVNGMKPFDNRAVTENICLIKEADNFKKDLTVHQVLKFASMLYSNWDKDLAADLLDGFDLNKKLRVKSLSKGMESALGIIVGLASKAPVTMLDEPYIGLDAASRAYFYEVLLEEFQSDPRIIILSTHLIDEVSNLFEEVIIFDKGSILLHKSADELRAQSFCISGPAAQVKTFTNGKQVIKETSFAGTSQAYFLSTEAPALTGDLAVSGVPLQDMMVHLTEKRGARA
ncbi:ABC transporter ATP-binding protein [Terribacillus saccharophilus]|uniref:ABC transporter ATP-binding protein n=1 Tax=Terribacillus saccharophilus TaxID=361277 RepID=A0A268HBM3_9BACI|nr:ABC transporter ATP-binding protein [Terribacillus saccharophilus]PAD35587.1 ABC transporter ATP-binding protein [Terribacillus saccharophilus]PAD96452.1 ABC transporter ATP-binding protein [Terribacillus saccharophilus]PAE00028.1 ABC transporter ATP-binding protein [Terribacillus saccharophilus]PAE07276.1 ABC transporter ATP-binding protein [Terribacillus saccharophilus]